MYSIPHHHSQFDFDERAMLIGGKLLLSRIDSYVRDGKESLHHVEVKSNLDNKTTIGHIKPIVVLLFCKGIASKYVL